MLLSHCRIELFFHLVLCTKWRDKTLSKDALAVIDETFDFLAERYNIKRLQSNIDQDMPDHWHCVFELQSLDCNLQKFVTSLKSMSSRKLKAVIPAWQGYSASYYLGTLSQNGNELDNALAYVKSQHGNGC